MSRPRMTTIIEFMLDQEVRLREVKKDDYNERLNTFYNNLLNIINAASFRLRKHNLPMNYIETCMDDMFENKPVVKEMS